MNNLKYSDSIEYLLRNLPEIREFYEQRVPQLYANGLAHVIYGSVLVEYLDGLLQDVTSGSTTALASAQTITKAFGLVEKLSESDDAEAQNLIETSFLEGLWHPSRRLSLFAEYFGPETQRLGKLLEERST